MDVEKARVTGRAERLNAQTARFSTGRTNDVAERLFHGALVSRARMKTSEDEQLQAPLLRVAEHRGDSPPAVDPPQRDQPAGHEGYGKIPLEQAAGEHYGAKLPFGPRPRLTDQIGGGFSDTRPQRRPAGSGRRIIRSVGRSAGRYHSRSAASTAPVRKLFCNFRSSGEAPGSRLTWSCSGCFKELSAACFSRV